mgnify:CR=1 FL=1|jgi:hypothetical protein
MEANFYENMSRDELIAEILRLKKEKDQLKETLNELEKKQLRVEQFKRYPYIKPPWLH